MYSITDLSELADGEYRLFNAKLLPGVPLERIIGVRTPALRKYAAELYKSGEYMSFLEELPHSYYEEDNLHAFLIEKIKDFDTAISLTERFLPYIDNWATCDCFSPAVFGKMRERLLPYIKKWIASGSTYEVRYGIGMLMRHFLDGDFKPEYPAIVASVRSEEYYVKMMVAWYFATALAKQYESVIPYFEEKRLECWTHNKAIQKAVESYRVTDGAKAYLRTLKIK